MFDGFDNEYEFGVAGINPARQTFSGYGYDRHSYISTAGLAAYPYTTKAAIAARYSGENDVIAASNDQTGPDLGAAVLAQVIANVTTEINGFISTIYPIPLAKTGTVAIIKVTGVSADGLGTITSIEVVQAGSYATAPASPNSPAYLRQIDSSDEEWFWLCNQQQGTGAKFTVAFANGDPALVAGITATPISVNGTPTISAGGANYQCGEILVLTGGSSYVPDKITNAATLLCCYELSRRRISSDEQNLFAPDAKLVKEELLKIGNGGLVLDGTYKRFYSPVASWGTRSVLFGASAL